MDMYFVIFVVGQLNNLRSQDCNIAHRFHKNSFLKEMSTTLIILPNGVLRLLPFCK